MPDRDGLPVPPGPDPLDGGEADVLRPEVLRLRDLVLGLRVRNDVLLDRVAELENQVEELAERNRAVEAELARNPVVRTARAAGAAMRRLRDGREGP